MLRKVLVAALAIASLAGCVAYEVPVGGHREYRGDRGYERDRDRDGTPDRADRDRDGDGVRNRQDRRPEDPRRY